MCSFDSHSSPMGLGRKTKNTNRKVQKRKLESETPKLKTFGTSTKIRRLIPPSAEPNLTCGSSTIEYFELIPIKGDGNCLFRAISYCLFGTEEKDNEIRSIATDFQLSTVLLLVIKHMEEILKMLLIINV